MLVVYYRRILAFVSVTLTLLGLLEREPSYGYDLKRDYDSHFARGAPVFRAGVHDPVQAGPDGKAVAGPPEQGDGPERKRYWITDSGAAEVDAWLATPIEPEPHLQPVLFAKVTLALMLGRPADTYLDGQRVAHLKRMRELTQLKDAGSLTDTLLADYGLFHLEADLRWIDLTAARLSELRGKKTARPR